MKKKSNVPNLYLTALTEKELKLLRGKHAVKESAKLKSEENMWVTVNPSDDKYHCAFSNLIICPDISEFARGNALLDLLCLAYDTDHCTTQSVGDILKYLRCLKAVTNSNQLRAIITKILHGLPSVLGHALYTSSDMSEITESARLFSESISKFIYDEAGNVLAPPYQIINKMQVSPICRDVMTSGRTKLLLDRVNRMNDEAYEYSRKLKRAKGENFDDELEAFEMMLDDSETAENARVIYEYINANESLHGDKSDSMLDLYTRMMSSLCGEMKLLKKAIKEDNIGEEIDEDFASELDDLDDDKSQENDNQVANTSLSEFLAHEYIDRIIIDIGNYVSDLPYIEFDFFVRVLKHLDENLSVEYSELEEDPAIYNIIRSMSPLCYMSMLDKMKFVLNDDYLIYDPTDGKEDWWIMANYPSDILIEKILFSIKYSLYLKGKGYCQYTDDGEDAGNDN